MKKEYVIYDLNGISQVGEIIFKGNKIVVKSVTTLVDPPHIEAKYDYEFYYNKAEIEKFYDDKVASLKEEIRICESRRKRATEHADKYFK